MEGVIDLTKKKRKSVKKLMTRQDIKKKSGNPQARSWVFTLNNPSEAEQEVVLKEGGSPEVIVCTVGQETGDNGTPHLQGYFRWENNKKLSWCKSFLPRAHWELRKGSEEQAVEYTRKDGKMLIDKARKSQQGKRNDIHQAVEILKTAGPRGVAEQFPATFVRYGSGFERLHLYLYKQPLFKERRVEWHYGPTGIGKTYGIMLRAQQAESAGKRVYKHTGPWNFMGMYVDHDWVIFDDFRHSECRPQDFLAICDVYAHTVPVKGSYRSWVADTVIFTCPNSPANELAQWGLIRGEDVAQFMRRITKIYHYHDDRVDIEK